MLEGRARRLGGARNRTLAIVLLDVAIATLSKDGCLVGLLLVECGMMSQGLCKFRRMSR